MPIKDLLKTVTPRIAALQGRKHSLNHIRPDALIVGGIEPVDTIVSRPGPLLLVKLIEVYFFILQLMLIPSFVKSFLIKWGGVIEGQFIRRQSIQSLVNIDRQSFLHAGGMVGLGIDV